MREFQAAGPRKGLTSGTASRPVRKLYTSTVSSFKMSWNCMSSASLRRGTSSLAQEPKIRSTSSLQVGVRLEWGVAGGRTDAETRNAASPSPLLCAVNEALAEQVIHCDLDISVESMFWNTLRQRVVLFSQLRVLGSNDVRGWHRAAHSYGPLQALGPCGRHSSPSKYNDTGRHRGWVCGG